MSDERPPGAAPEPLPPPPEYGGLRGAALRRRASAGLFLVGSRGFAVLLLGFAGYVVLARLLTPREFGVYAVGLVLVSVAALLSDGGLGAGLIRRTKRPTRGELRALIAFQLTVTGALVAVVVVIATIAPLGQVGWVSAVLVASMPLVAFQFPGRIVLERSLHYRPLAIIEVSQVLTYHTTAIGLVLAGLGVWGLAIAFFLRTAVGTVLIVRVSPTGLLAPQFSWQSIRPLMGFGIRFQATTGTELLRDQAMNWVIALVTSVSTLGLWSLVRRLMEAPLLLIETFGRVAFSTMSRLVEAREESARLIERILAIAATTTGVALTGLAGSAAGLVPSVFGQQWSGASAAVPWTCLALAISGSACVTMRSYLFAVGDAGAVLRVSALQAATVLAVTVPLLRSVGVAAVGLGWLAAAVVEATLLGRATRRWTHIRWIRQLMGPVCVGIATASAGWVLTERLLGTGTPGLLAGLAGAVCSGVGFVLGMLLVRRALLFDAIRFTVGTIRAGMASGEASAPNA